MLIKPKIPHDLYCSNSSSMLIPSFIAFLNNLYCSFAFLSQSKQMYKYAGLFLLLPTKIPSVKLGVEKCSFSESRKYINLHK